MVSVRSDLRLLHGNSPAPERSPHPQKPQPNMPRRPFIRLLFRGKRPIRSPILIVLRTRASPLQRFTLSIPSSGLIPQLLPSLRVLSLSTLRRDPTRATRTRQYVWKGTEPVTTYEIIIERMIQDNPNLAGVDMVKFQ